MAARFVENVVHRQPGGFRQGGDALLFQGEFVHVGAGAEAQGQAAEALVEHFQVLAQVVGAGVEHGVAAAPADPFQVFVERLDALLVFRFGGWQAPGHVVVVKLRLAGRQVRVFLGLGLGAGEVVAQGGDGVAQGHQAPNSQLGMLSSSTLGTVTSLDK